MHPLVMALETISSPDTTGSTFMKAIEQQYCFNQIIKMGVLVFAHILVFVPHPDNIWDLYRPFSSKVSSDFVDTGPA